MVAVEEALKEVVTHLGHGIGVVDPVVFCAM